MCNHLVATSRTVLDSAPNNIFSQKKTLVLNPVSTGPCLDKKTERANLHKQYGVPIDCFLIGYVGRLVEYKEVSFLLKCLSEIGLKSEEKFHFVIIGTGKEEYCQQLKQIVATLGLETNVTFTGFIRNPSKLIASLDVLVTASRVDALGRTLVEAMLQKTTVLAVNAGGHKELVSNGITGFLYSPNNTHDFIEKFRLLRDNIKLRRKISDAAYQWVQNKFSIEDHVDKIIAIYKKVIVQ